MMRAVADLTKPFGIFTLVSLNAIMVDAPACAVSCRRSAWAGETKFACFDGPDFDGHKVDFAMLRNRQDGTRPKEQCDPSECKIGRVAASGPVDYSQYLNAPVTDLGWQNLDLGAIKPARR